MLRYFNSIARLIFEYFEAEPTAERQKLNYKFTLNNRK
jgi:hypothetical protein